MKKIIIISLLSSLQLFCGSDEEAPLMREVENYSAKQQISSKEFYDAIYDNKAKFIQKNLQKLRPTSQAGWIGLMTAAQANVISKQELVKSAAQAKFLHRKKSRQASRDLANALAIQKFIKKAEKKNLQSIALQQNAQVVRKVELPSDPQEMFVQVSLN